MLTSALLAGGAALALTANMSPLAAQDGAAAVAQGSPISTNPIVPRAGAPTSFADLTAALQPAVVNISTRQRVRVPANPFAGTPFEGLFGQGQPGAPGGGQGQTRRGSSLGSGFIISADGYIVTNNHVVSPGAPNAVVEQVTVTMPDRREYVARVVGRDPDSDLAVLKIEASGLPHVAFGDSQRTRVGDWVVAIGNPLGLGGTVTAGIVSALYRNVGPGGVGQGGAYDRYIQTDAAINQGNSGGPLFDMNGRVVGINSSILSSNPGGGSIGIGFAIPAEVAEPIVRQLIAGRTIARGYIGVERAPLTDDLANSLGITKEQGEFIQRVTPGGAAARAGIREGDVVLAINGESVTPDRNLSYIVANLRPGQRVPIELLRGGRRQTVTVTVDTRPSLEQLQGERFDPSEQQDFNQAPAQPQGGDASIRTQLGLVTQQLTPEIARQVGIDSTTRGVVIAAVSGSFDAASKGLQRGDVILNAHGRAVTSNADLAAAIQEARSQRRTAILVQVVRRGIRPAFIPLLLAE